MRADEPGRRNTRGKATARAIERAAVLLAEEHGAEGFTVHDICTAVGITERTFFNHFAAKDDALLGWDVPHLSEVAVERYLADPEIGILTGALTLVDLPAELLDEPDLARARVSVLATAPTLARRQGERLGPLVDEVAEVIERKLRDVLGAGVPDDEVADAAGALARMGAALLLDQPALDPRRAGLTAPPQTTEGPFALLARLADRLF